MRVRAQLSDCVEIAVGVSVNDPTRRLVPARFVSPHFAVTESTLGRLYSLTHRPTGYRVVDAEQIARLTKLARLLERTGIDWSFTDPKRGREFINPSRDAIRDAFQKTRLV